MFNPLEHRLLKALRKDQEKAEFNGHGLWERPWLIMISGGMDSMVLLHLLRRLQPILKVKLQVLHIHHGGCGTQAKFRDRAARLVESECKKLGVPFRVHKLPLQKEGSSESEDSLRKLRWEVAQTEAQNVGMNLGAQPALLLTAHHLDDLLETRLLRLMRGTGPAGLTSIRRYNLSLGRYRPLLGEPRAQLAEYANERDVKWIEDPSNQSRAPLRNWIRHEVIPVIQERNPSLVKNMGLSLDRLAVFCAGAQGGDLPNLGSEKMPALTEVQVALPTFSVEGAWETWVQSIANLFVCKLTRFQIEEILKQLDCGLDNSSRGHMFVVARLEWSFNAGQIRIRLL